MLSQQFWIAYLSTVIISYLLGSVNFAVLVSRLYAKEDVRAFGSGNAGMTNILRKYGKAPAAITCIGDFMKCLIAMVISRYIFVKMGVLFVDAGYISGLFVLLGHLYPVFFGFKGGKGVVVTAAVAFLTNPLIFAVLLPLALVLIFATGFVSLGSITAAILFPVATFVVNNSRNTGSSFDVISTIVISALVVYQHRENIQRLIKGTENRFTRKK